MALALEHAGLKRYGDNDLLNYKGKNKNVTMRSGGHVLRSSGNRANWKKAIITLKEGSKIDLVEGDFS